MSFHRVENDAPEDEYVTILGMIVSNIEFKITDKILTYTFRIMQKEDQLMTRMIYRCTSKDQELKLCHLYKPFGTLVLVNKCIKNGAIYEIDYDDDLIVLAFRPNNYQVGKFLQEIIKSITLT